ncbi:MAG TPA: hypothetical protein DCQ87_07340 [Lachnospiraceae bacterium]|nr:hypothetical protein [Lachnospiraceae bacterium]
MQCLQTSNPCFASAPRSIKESRSVSCLLKLIPTASKGFASFFCRSVIAISSPFQKSSCQIRLIIVKLLFAGDVSKRP